MSALEFTKAHYHVLEVDISKYLIAIARTRVPDAGFRVESLFKTDIPPSCSAVTSIGECFNYLFDADNNCQILVQVFHRIYNALAPGGIFIFDIAEPGLLMQGNTTKGFTEGKDWIVLVEKEEDRKQSTLIRRIITLRKVEGYYRRDDEVHHLQLYESKDVAEKLPSSRFPSPDHA